MLSLNFKPFPLLDTERLYLREITLNDVPEVFKLRSSEKVMQFIDRPIATKPEDAAELINKIIFSLKENEGITWGITLKSNLKLIGTIGFWKIEKEHYRAEIGYALHPDFHRKGIMQEAMSTVLEHGFKKMNLHSVEANINPENEVSKKLLAKNNFVQEAYFKENYFSNGKFLDSAIYSLITPFK